jgi:energy-coupling factor transport system ATP-binding protein
MNQGELFKEGSPEQIFELDEELISLGLDIPFPIKMSKALRKKGFTFSRHFLSEEELVNELWTSHYNK